MDNKGLDRTDSNFEKTRILSFDVSKKQVTGINDRYTGVQHKRTIEFQDNTISILDNIESEASHNYKILWHLAPDINCKIEGKTVNLYRNGILIADVIVDADVKISETKGQTNPLQGWYFDSMYDTNPTPISVLTVEANGSNVSIPITINFFD